MNTEIQFILYHLPDEEGKVQVVIKDETLWCTQKAMAQFFDVDKSGISRHVTNIFKDKELQPDTTVAKIATVVNRGIRGEVEELVDFYNLDMIIAVGYRVSSPKATKFRQWATKVLNEYIKKGFAMDDERLKQGITVFGKDYFRELLDRVRSIRASERRIWQQMTQFSASANEFLAFRRYQILPDKGKISKAEADAKAKAEYDIFNRTQHIDSDFDKEVRAMLGDRH
jgi:hypothetical protein